MYNIGVLIVPASQVATSFQFIGASFCEKWSVLWAHEVHLQLCPIPVHRSCSWSQTIALPTSTGHRLLASTTFVSSTPSRPLRDTTTTSCPNGRYCTMQETSHYIWMYIYYVYLSILYTVPYMGVYKRDQGDVNMWACVLERKPISQP